MSGLDLDALAESARNRGLKLVRSRVRTPGKRGFGKVGLADVQGKPVFGLDEQGPGATPEDVADYLRNLGASDWGASLEVAVIARKKTRTKPLREGARAAKKVEPTAPPKPRREPVLDLRDAKPADAPALAKLMRPLGHELSEAAVRKNLAALARLKELPLVATLDDKVIGLCGIHMMTAIHRDAPVGRITILIVEQELRGEGIGRKLVEEAERRLRKSGCKIIEVTSNDRLGPAHAFYRHMGYERTSLRFAKTP